MEIILQLDGYWGWPPDPTKKQRFKKIRSRTSIFIEKQIFTSFRFMMEPARKARSKKAKTPRNSSGNVFQFFFDQP